MIPIFTIVVFWWAVLSLPLLLVGIPSLTLMASPKPVEFLVGGVLYLMATIYAFTALYFAAPWFFRWYFIAVGLMFNRRGMADRKEGELVSAIRNAEATTGTT
jgi:hypothetical protein